MHDLGKVLACRNVDVRVISQRAAGQRVKTLKQPEIVRHHEDHADIRNEGDRTDLIHEVAIEIRALQANHAADGKIKKP